MRRSSVVILSLCVALLALAAALPGHRWLGAQEAPAATTQELMRATVPELPPTRALVRLLRISVEPGAGSPVHTHPGPEFGLVESGSLAVTVRGPATLRRASTTGTPSPVIEPSPDTEFIMNPGDSIAYPAGTPMGYRNTGTGPVVFLAAVILPVGLGAPPTLVWTDGPPPEDALNGVLSLVLGDGEAPSLPPGPAVVTIERVSVPVGGTIPGDNRAVLVVLESGGLDFTLVGGETQVWRAGTAGVQPNAAPGSGHLLGAGDALFFPQGMAAAPRSSGDTDLVVLRMSIGAADAPPPVGTPVGVGQIAVSTPTPIPTATPTAAPPTPTARPATRTPTPQPAIGEGSIVVVTEDGVRLRGSPSTEGEVVTTLAAGQELEITGPAEEGGDFLWWPVFDPNTGLNGYVAADFIEPLEDEE